MWQKLMRHLPLRAYPELDGVRFISIFLVVLHHQFLTQNRVLLWFHDYGWVGVDIFFTLSGFLITGLLLKELERDHRINLKKFWWRRMLRLWPSWLVAMSIASVMIYYFGRHNPELRRMLVNNGWHYYMHFANYSRALAGHIHDLLGIYWSLAVEEHFYLFWPLLLFLIRDRKKLLLVMVGLVILPNFSRYIHLQMGHDRALFALLTHNRIDELLIGCLLALHFERIPLLTKRMEVMLMSAMIIFFGLGLKYCHNRQVAHELQAISYTLIGIASAALIVIAMKGHVGGLRRLLRLGLLARLGMLSYGVYLIHLPVNYCVYALLARYPLVQDQNLIAVINTVLPFIPAYLMYRYIDEYFARFRH